MARPSTATAERLAEALSRTARAHRSTLAILDYAPPTDAAPGCRNPDNCGAQASDAGAYGQFATSVAQLCRQEAPGLCNYELWNEENIGQFWSPATDPAAYAKLSCTAYRAIKQVDPDGQVLLGGMSPAPSTNGDYSPPRFMETLYAGGIKSCFDAVGMHVYASTPALAQAERSYQIMQAHGDGGKKIWATEMGFEWRPPFTTDQSAAIATQFRQMVDAWQAEPFAGPAYWYTLSDDRGPDSPDTQHFGLLTKIGQPKPGLATAFLKAAA